MTTSVHPVGRKAAPVRAKSVKPKRKVAGTRRKRKTLAQMNRWMAENADAVLKAARQNTLHLTGKEVL